jgi:hypothetical protein
VDSQTVVIRLELHLAGESLTGRASDATGAAEEFVGWMGLTAAVDALVQGRTRPPTSSSDRSQVNRSQQER